jgi:hypothetical protein
MAIFAAAIINQPMENGNRVATEWDKKRDLSAFAPKLRGQIWYIFFRVSHCYGSKDCAIIIPTMDSAKVQMTGYYSKLEESLCLCKWVSVGTVKAMTTSA